MRQYVNELSHGDAVKDVFLVAEKQLRANRNGNLYLQVELRDRTGTISSRLWNATEDLYGSFEEGDFVAVEGKVQLYQGALQMILNRLHPAPRANVDLADFLPHSGRDLERLEHRLRALLLELGDPHLRALAECFLIDETLMRRFAEAPAGIKNHHAYVGGLLEHVVTMLEAAARIVDLYPTVDRDLLMLGIFLHDIGKVTEFRHDRAFSYSDEGQLIGHLMTGVEILNAKVREAENLTGEPLPEELLLRLKHMIVSHHGSYEFGSPKLPMTPEAIALHYLDNLDAKIHTFNQQIQEDLNPGSAWTAYNASLGRKLYKGSAEVGNQGLPMKEGDNGHS
ncbi:MAG: HD domain-containing protein [Planctomycetes bacterium]|nr:HD domain-containing protein [Planctomycetota bacterium]